MFDPSDKYDQTDMQQSFYWGAISATVVCTVLFLCALAVVGV